MGISRLSAMMIQGNDKENIVCDSAGPSKENGKYSGWILLIKNGEFHTNILSTNSIYNSGDDAVTAMESVVEEIRRMEL